MEMLITLGRTLGFSLGAGVNLYATVAVLGLASRYGWVTLPEQYRVFDNPYIIGAAVVMYVIEFFADKIPWLDSAWDMVHTFIRPVGGAVIAIAALGDASPEMKTLIGLLGGGVAASSHFTKTGTRALANTSPEPFTNWILSFGEDVFVVSLALIAMTHPLIALAIVIVALTIIAIFAAVIWRAVRRWFRTSRQMPAPRTA